MAGHQQMLLGVTPAGGGGGGALDVVAVTNGENFGSSISPTIPAVGSGHSLIVITTSNRNDLSVTGAVSDSGAATFGGKTAQFFHINNVVDGRTSVTITSPSGTSIVWAVLEVDATGVATASTIASGTGTGTSLAVPFTTTADSAAGFMAVNLSNETTQTGGSGWVAVPGTLNYDPFAYNEDLGTAGSKSTALTLGATLNWGAAVQAYVRV